MDRSRGFLKSINETFLLFIIKYLVLKAHFLLDCSGIPCDHKISGSCYALYMNLDSLRLIFENNALFCVDFF